MQTWQLLSALVTPDTVASRCYGQPHRGRMFRAFSWGWMPAPLPGWRNGIRGRLKPVCPQGHRVRLPSPALTKERRCGGRGPCRVASDAGRRAGDDDHPLAFGDRPDSIRALSTWRIMSSVWPTMGDQERLDAPAQGQAGRVCSRGEGKHGDRRAQPGQPAGRVAGVREGDQELGLDALGHVGGGLVIAPLVVCGSQLMSWTRSSPCSSVFSTIRAIVSTVSTGYSPTLVSPDSITASAPSRIGVGDVGCLGPGRAGCGDHRSSIWVATITGFAQRRAAVTICFCTSGTSSSGSSTPRSPRATMIASKASMISSRWSTRLRLLDLGDHRDAAALLVHDLVYELDVLGATDEGQATMSTPCAGPSAGPRCPSRSSRARSPRRRAG